MDYSTSGLPVHHQLPEFTQTHVQWVSNAIQPSQPLSSPFSPTFSLSQHQSLFKWVKSSHQVVKVLEFQLQHQSFQWLFRTDILWWTGWISLLSKGHWRVFSNTAGSKASVLQCSAFFIVQLSYPYVTTGKPITGRRWKLIDRWLCGVILQA